MDMKCTKASKEMKSMNSIYIYIYIYIYMCCAFIHLSKGRKEENKLSLQCQRCVTTVCVYLLSVRNM